MFVLFLNLFFLEECCIDGFEVFCVNEDDWLVVVGEVCCELVVMVVFLDVGF